jgi:hypothetical protein
MTFSASSNPHLEKQYITLFLTAYIKIKKKKHFILGKCRTAAFFMAFR